jgi:hypothetical protein
VPGSMLFIPHLLTEPPAKFVMCIAELGTLPTRCHQEMSRLCL